MTKKYLVCFSDDKEAKVYVEVKAVAVGSKDDIAAKVATKATEIIKNFDPIACEASVAEMETTAVETTEVFDED